MRKIKRNLKEFNAVYVVVALTIIGLYLEVLI